MKVGFLGLGGMGAAMATRLVQAGLEVTLWNRSAAACEPLVALGATRAEEGSCRDKGKIHSLP
ncbi:NAD(P)-binding domain-containing protein, partial [Pseudomonas aeruginosa]|uniref:NAD(P)-binding domain-containing protein n=1 Tax=Pseudomonas aeruginosa TaxID=287 RepID=UPI001C94008B